MVGSLVAVHSLVVVALAAGSADLPHDALALVADCVSLGSATAA